MFLLEVILSVCVLHVADVIDDDDDDLVDDNLENAINNALGASTNYNSPYSTLEGGPCRPWIEHTILEIYY